MKYIFIFLLTLWVTPVFASYNINPYTGKFDRCLTVKEEDGSPANNICGDIKVTNGALTDNADGTFSLSLGSGGTPGGSDTEIQFNDGSAFGGDADYTWNKTSNILYVNGNAGIGSVAPGAKLEITGTNNTTGLKLRELATSGSRGTFIDFHNANTGGSDPVGQLRFWSGGNTTQVAGITATTGTSGTLGVLTFSTNSGSALTERMRIVNNGNVGIGTASPRNFFDVTPISAPASPFIVTTVGNVGISTVTPLHIFHAVGGSGGTNIAKFERNSGAFGYIATNVSGGDPQILFDANNGGTQWAIGNVLGTDDFRITDGSAIRTGGSDRLVINSSGNMGVGTFSPGALLQVGTGTGFRVNSSFNISAIGGNANATITSSAINMAASSMTVTNASSNANSNLTLTGSNAATGFVRIKSTTGVGSSDFVDIVGGNNGATTIATFLGSGNVGIGTAIPIAKLEVNGLIVPDKVTADPCSSGAPEGGAFYNDTSNYWCYCDGTNDVKMNDPATACF